MKLSYWEDRESERVLNELLNKAEGELSKEYLRSARKVRQQLVQLYNELSTSTGEILVSDLYKYNRYYELLGNLDSILTELGVKEEGLYSKLLEDYYRKNCEIIGKEINWLMPIDEEQVKKAINSIWCQDGKHWSSRIWTNKAALEERIKQGMIDCLASGAGKDELVRRLMEDFNVGFNQADRIARTELAYIQNKSTLDKYEQAGIKKYKVLANQAEDEVCGGLDGKEFFLHEAKVGVNFPPIHPNCKCCILAVL